MARGGGACALVVLLGALAGCGGSNDGASSALNGAGAGKQP